MMNVFIWSFFDFRLSCWASFHAPYCHLMWSTLLRTLQLRMCIGCVLEGGQAPHGHRVCFDLLLRSDGSGYFSCFHGAEEFFSAVCKAIVSVQSCNKNGETSTRGSYTTAVKKTRLGKIIHFPVNIKKHRSNCVNAERRLDKREVVSRALLLLNHP